MWIRCSWQNEDDVERDLFRLSRYNIRNEDTAATSHPIPETILNYRQRMAANKEKTLHADIDDSVSYIVSGRGRGIRDRVIRPGGTIEYNPIDDIELGKQIRQLLELPTDIFITPVRLNEIEKCLLLQDLANSVNLIQKRRNSSEENEAGSVPKLRKLADEVVAGLGYSNKIIEQSIGAKRNIEQITTSPDQRFKMLPKSSSDSPVDSISAESTPKKRNIHPITID